MIPVKLLLLALLALPVKTIPNTYSSQENCRLFVPNAFSPNRDGINDEFRPQAGAECAIQDYQLRIFDRRGALVFESNAPEQGWNGSFRRQRAPGGVYYYRISYRLSTSAEEEIIVLDGDVALMR